MGHRRYGIGGLLVGGALLAFPLSGASCASTACFVWSADQGPCPAQSDAIDFFSRPFCPATVKSVDGQGTFDGQFCCYPVTQTGEPDIPVVGCVDDPSSGAGGAVIGPSSAGGSGGGEPSCDRCVEAFASDPIDPSFLCETSKAAFNQLFACACMGPCAAQCEDTVCAVGAIASDACSQCAGEPDPAGCADEIDACASN